MNPFQFFHSPSPYDGHTTSYGLNLLQQERGTKDRAILLLRQAILGGSGNDNLYSDRDLLNRLEALEGDMTELFPALTEPAAEVLDQYMNDLSERLTDISCASLTKKLSEILLSSKIEADPETVADFFLYGLQRVLYDVFDSLNKEPVKGDEVTPQMKRMIHDSLDIIQNVLILALNARSFSDTHTEPGSAAEKVCDLLETPLRQKTLALLICHAFEKEIAPYLTPTMLADVAKDLENLLQGFATNTDMPKRYFAKTPPPPEPAATATDGSKATTAATETTPTTPTTPTTDSKATEPTSSISPWLVTKTFILGAIMLSPASAMSINERHRITALTNGTKPRDQLSLEWDNMTMPHSLAADETMEDKQIRVKRYNSAAIPPKDLLPSSIVNAWVTGDPVEMAKAEADYETFIKTVQNYGNAQDPQAKKLIEAYNKLLAELNTKYDATTFPDHVRKMLHFTPFQLQLATLQQLKSQPTLAPRHYTDPVVLGELVAAISYKKNMEIASQAATAAFTAARLAHAQGANKFIIVPQTDLLTLSAFAEIKSVHGLCAGMTFLEMLDRQKTRQDPALQVQTHESFIEKFDKLKNEIIEHAATDTSRTRDIELAKKQIRFIEYVVHKGKNDFLHAVFNTLQRPITDTAEHLHTNGIKPPPIQVGPHQVPVHFYHDTDMGALLDRAYEISLSANPVHEFILADFTAPILGQVSLAPMQVKLTKKPNQLGTTGAIAMPASNHVMSCSFPDPNAPGSAGQKFTFYDSNRASIEVSTYRELRDFVTASYPVIKDRFTILEVDAQNLINAGQANLFPPGQAVPIPTERRFGLIGCDPEKVLDHIASTIAHDYPQVANCEVLVKTVATNLAKEKYNDLFKMDKDRPLDKLKGIWDANNLSNIPGIFDVPPPHQSTVDNKLKRSASATDIFSTSTLSMLRFDVAKKLKMHAAFAIETRSRLQRRLDNINQNFHLYGNTNNKATTDAREWHIHALRKIRDTGQRWQAVLFQHQKTGEKRVLPVTSKEVKQLEFLFRRAVKNSNRVNRFVDMASSVRDFVSHAAGPNIGNSRQLTMEVLGHADNVLWAGKKILTEKGLLTGASLMRSAQRSAGLYGLILSTPDFIEQIEAIHRADSKAGKVGAALSLTGNSVMVLSSFIPFAPPILLPAVHGLAKVANAFNMHDICTRDVAPFLMTMRQHYRVDESNFHSQDNVTHIDLATITTKDTPQLRQAPIKQIDFTSSDQVIVTIEDQHRIRTMQQNAQSMMSSHGSGAVIFHDLLRVDPQSSMPVNEFFHVPTVQHQNMTFHDNVVLTLAPGAQREQMFTWTPLNDANAVSEFFDQDPIFQEVKQFGDRRLRILRGDDCMGPWDSESKTPQQHHTTKLLLDHKNFNIRMHAVPEDYPQQKIVIDSDSGGKRTIYLEPQQVFEINEKQPTTYFFNANSGPALDIIDVNANIRWKNRQLFINDVLRAQFHQDANPEAIGVHLDDGRMFDLDPHTDRLQLSAIDLNNPRWKIASNVAIAQRSIINLLADTTQTLESLVETYDPVADRILPRERAFWDAVFALPQDAVLDNKLRLSLGKLFLSHIIDETEADVLNKFLIHNQRRFPQHISSFVALRSTNWNGWFDSRKGEVVSLPHNAPASARNANLIAAFPEKNNRFLLLHNDAPDSAEKVWVFDTQKIAAPVLEDHENSATHASSDAVIEYPLSLTDNRHNLDRKTIEDDNGHLIGFDGRTGKPRIEGWSAAYWQTHGAQILQGNQTMGTPDIPSTQWLRIPLEKGGMLHVNPAEKIVLTTSHHDHLIVKHIDGKKVWATDMESTNWFSADLNEDYRAHAFSTLVVDRDYGVVQQPSQHRLASPQFSASQESPEIQQGQGEVTHVHPDNYPVLVRLSRSWFTVPQSSDTSTPTSTSSVMNKLAATSTNASDVIALGDEGAFPQAWYFPQLQRVTLPLEKAHTKTFESDQLEFIGIDPENTFAVVACRNPNQPIVYVLPLIDEASHDIEWDPSIAFFTATPREEHPSSSRLHEALALDGFAKAHAFNPVFFSHAAGINAISEEGFVLQLKWQELQHHAIPPTVIRLLDDWISKKAADENTAVPALPPATIKRRLQEDIGENPDLFNPGKVRTASWLPIDFPARNVGDQISPRTGYAAIFANEIRYFDADARMPDLRPFNLVSVMTQDMGFLFYDRHSDSLLIRQETPATSTNKTARAFGMGYLGNSASVTVLCNDGEVRTPIEMTDLAMPLSDVTLFVHDIKENFNLVPLCGVRNIVLSFKSEDYCKLTVSSAAADHFDSISYNQPGKAHVKIPSATHGIAQVRQFITDAKNKLLRVTLCPLHRPTILEALHKTQLDILYGDDREIIRFTHNGVTWAGTADAMVSKLEKLIVPMDVQNKGADTLPTVRFSTDAPAKLTNDLSTPVPS